jgi:translation elongation factor EF-G
MVFTRDCKCPKSSARGTEARTYPANGTQCHSFAASSNGQPGTTVSEKPSAAGLFSDKISYGFQLATSQGPLCHEPVQGIAVFIEAVTVTANGEDEMSRLTGEVIRSVKDSIWQGFLDWSPRLLLGMYSCEIQASSETHLPLLLDLQAILFHYQRDIF